jgi:uncharacterized protein YoxC
MEIPEGSPPWLKTIVKQLNGMSQRLDDINTVVLDTRKEVKDLKTSIDFAVNKAEDAMKKGRRCNEKN